jgi:hypothetical protein
MSTERVAFTLQVELNRRLGRLPQVEQVDFHRCEGFPDDWMACVYFDDGYYELVLCERTGPFDRRAVEHALIRGCQETVH